MERDFKLKLFENKSKESRDLAPFILTYEHSQYKNENQTREMAYSIISSFKSENDVVIEINSSLMTKKGSGRQSYIFELIEKLKAMGLNYRYRKTPGPKPSFFSMFFGKSEEVHEILMHVPDSVWNMQEFKSILPVYGAKYYILKDNLEANETLDNMYRMTDEDKLNFYKLIVFDPGILDRMTINTRHLNLNDLKELLRLS